MHPEYTASFRMRDSLTFAVVVWGTRGDVQPVLVLAQELQRRGHKVRLSVPPEHVELAAKFHLEDSTTPLVTGVAYVKPLPCVDLPCARCLPPTGVLRRACHRHLTHRG